MDARPDLGSTAGPPARSSTAYESETWEQESFSTRGTVEAAALRSSATSPSDNRQASTSLLFAEDRVVPSQVGPAVQNWLKKFELHRPRQWGACWLALELGKTFQVD